MMIKGMDFWIIGNRDTDEKEAALRKEIRTRGFCYNKLRFRSICSIFLTRNPTGYHKFCDDAYIEKHTRYADRYLDSVDLCFVIDVAQMTKTAKETVDDAEKCFERISKLFNEKRER